MIDFLEFLRNTSYPGRGIAVGKDRVYYFIMGRSENSRNRIFSLTEDGIRTEAFDASIKCDKLSGDMLPKSNSVSSNSFVRIFRAFVLP